MKPTKQAYQEVNAVSGQMNSDSVQDGLFPTGNSVLYKVNPDKSVTPATDGYTSSSNQLTTSGK